MTPITEDVHMSPSPSVLRNELIENKDDKPYRHAYADESLNISIATQLKVLREQRELTQEELAETAGMRQPMISRYENVNYSSWSINTLKKLAVAFDVWLDVRFRSFGELVKTTEEFSRESLEVPKFDDDPFFKETPAIAANDLVSSFGEWPLYLTSPQQAVNAIECTNIIPGAYVTEWSEDIHPQNLTAISRNAGSVLFPTIDAAPQYAKFKEAYQGIWQPKLWHAPVIEMKLPKAA